jgi:cyclophilin family peptidyl-prolyl cis-trans isomerase
MTSRFDFLSAIWRFVAALTAAMAFGLPTDVDAATVKTIVRFETGLGGFNVGLYDDDALLTVTNFLGYVTRGDYGVTVIHRSAPNFVLQGGGYTSLLPTQIHIPTDLPVQNEFDLSRSNLRGTIAMAKVGNDPNSATSEWFFNLKDNSANLDNQNGGFTVFGEVLDSGMDVIDSIAALETYNLTPFDPTDAFDPPLINGFFNPLIGNANFVYLGTICINVDRDGICPEVEDLAPNGDGNGDGTLDHDQTHVGSIRLNLPGRSATFAARTATMRIDGGVGFNATNSAIRLVSFLPPPNTAARFDDGVVTFTMAESAPGAMNPAGEIVDYFDRAPTRPTRYYALVSSPNPHWIDFTFDGTTGAEIQGDRIVMHFVDGGRGDDDGAVNGKITHTGAAAIESALTPPTHDENDWGCTIAKDPRSLSSRADWLVVFGVVALLSLRNRRQTSPDANTRSG